MRKEDTLNMKTWTNPSIEELEVKMTAANIFADEPEIDYDGKVELENIWGNPLLNPNPNAPNPTPTPENPVNPGQKS